MKILKFVNHVVLVALALSFSVGLGKAQNAIEGAFTLPVEVRWGGVNLPAGDYTLRVADVYASGLVTVQGGGKSAIILAGTLDTAQVSDHSRLVLVETDHGYAVKSFEAGQLGLSLDYPVSKLKATKYASNRAPLGNIEVAVLGAH